MLIVAVAIVITVAIPLCGGRYSALADLRIRGAWLVAAALGIQILIISVIELDSEAVARGLHLVTYAMIGVCIWLNRTLPFMWVVGLGWASNVMVIAANGGVMPTSGAAADLLGREPADGFENSAVLENPRLAFLGDALVTPGWLPLQNAFSIGDALLVVGLALVVWSASRAPVSDDASATVST